MIKKYINGRMGQWFHFKHELYTKLATIFPWLPPYRYVFVLTNQCNMKCENCFQDRKFSVEKAMAPQQWMDLSDAIPGWSRITMTGGEPLVLPNFRNIFKKVAARHSCNLITNGVLLNEESVDLLLSFPKFKVLAVSIDNLKSQGANLRGYSDSQWSHLESILRYFVHRRNEIRSSCLLEIKTLVCDENADVLFELHRFIMEVLEADHHSFQFLKGSPLQHADKCYALDQIFVNSPAPRYKKFDVIVNELKKIKQYNSQHQKTSFMHPKAADLNSEKPFKDISFLNAAEFDTKCFKACPFPWSSVHINYDGEVFPCLSVSLGNLRENRIQDILNGGARRHFQFLLRKNRLVQACNRCGWLRQAH
jgi:MoaA/NifB/PqqE/SkfB family radical SAM enzyme